MYEAAFKACVLRAADQVAQAPGSETWPVRERLTAFFFMVLDALEDLQLPDATAHFNREASPFGSAFHGALRDALRDMVDAPDVPTMNRVVCRWGPSRFVAAETMVQLLSISLADTSPDRQRSAGLVDRTLDFVSTVMANPIPSRAADLARYAAEAGYVPFVSGQNEDENHAR